jgi:hypothetical protein
MADSREPTAGKVAADVEEEENEENDLSKELQAAPASPQRAKQSRPVRASIKKAQAAAAAAAAAISSAERIKKQRNLNIQLKIKLVDLATRNQLVENGTAAIWLSGWVADYPDGENFMGLFVGSTHQQKSKFVNPFNYYNRDFNNYFVNGTNGVLGYMGAADINSLPFKTGVTDANRKTVNPNFTISSPTIALDYKPTVAELQSGGETDIAVTTDYAGTARTSNQMGAFVVNAPTNVNAVKSNIRVYQQNNGSLVIVADLSSLSESSAVSVIDLRGYVIFNETVEPKMLSIPLFEKGIYFVRIQSIKENATTKVLLF